MRKADCCTFHQCCCSSYREQQEREKNSRVVRPFCIPVLCWRESDKNEKHPKKSFAGQQVDISGLFVRSGATDKELLAVYENPVLEHYDPASHDASDKRGTLAARAESRFQRLGGAVSTHSLPQWKIATLRKRNNKRPPPMIRADSRRSERLMSTSLPASTSDCRLSSLGAGGATKAAAKRVSKERKPSLSLEVSRGFGSRNRALPRPNGSETRRV